MQSQGDKLHQAAKFQLVENFFDRPVRLSENSRFHRLLAQQKAGFGPDLCAFGVENSSEK